MRTLGVNASSECAFLALGEDGKVLEIDPAFLKPPAGLESTSKLIALRDDVGRLIGTFKIEAICILDAEANYKDSYKKLTNRITLETVFAFAAAEAEIVYGRMSRAKLRALFGWPKKGELAPFANKISESVGPYWNGKRSLAAATAIAHGKVER